MTFIHNIQKAFSIEQNTNTLELDRGDLVQTVLITAGFALTAILVVLWASNTTSAQAVTVSECIGQSSIFKPMPQVENCEDNTLAKEAATANEEDYYDRFGETE